MFSKTRKIIRKAQDWIKEFNNFQNCSQQKKKEKKNQMILFLILMVFLLFSFIPKNQTSDYKGPYLEEEIQSHLGENAHIFKFRDSFFCGDSIISHTETCDDGNDKSGDGCSRECRIEDGYYCLGAGWSSCHLSHMSHTGQSPLENVVESWFGGLNLRFPLIGFKVSMVVLIYLGLYCF